MMKILILALFVGASQALDAWVTCDDEVLELYIDGKDFTPRTANWDVWNRATKITGIPDDYDVIAIHGWDHGGQQGCVWDDGNGVQSNEDWKCVDKMQDGWYDPYFDDSNWPNASIYDSTNNDEGMPRIPEAGLYAQWIWQSDLSGDVSHAFCRYGKKPRGHPYCYCDIRYDPNLKPYDLMYSIAIEAPFKTYLASKTTVQCPFDVYVTTAYPRELVGVTTQITGIVNATLVYGGSSFVVTDENKLFVNGAPIPQSALAGPVSAVAYNNDKATNLTFACGIRTVTLQWTLVENKFDYNGNEVPFTQTALTIQVPKSNGANYVGACGNCDGISDDLETDKYGNTGLNPSSTANMTQYLASWEV